MRVASYPMISREPETKGRNFILNWLALLRLERQKLAAEEQIEPVRHFGFDIDVTQAQKDAGLRGYEVWVNAPEWVQPSGGVTIKQFPGGLYAMVVLENPFNDPYREIPFVWKALHEWVISSDSYRGASHQWLEEYIPYPKGMNYFDIVA